MRAVLVKTGGGEGVVFSPVLEPVRVELGRTWSISLPAARRFPVAVDPDIPEHFTLIDNPEAMPAPAAAVPGVPMPAAAGPPVGPSPVEIDCPSPSVQDYLGLLTGGAPSRLEDTDQPVLLQALALRVEQLRPCRCMRAFAASSGRTAGPNGSSRRSTPPAGGHTALVASARARGSGRGTRVAVGVEPAAARRGADRLPSVRAGSAGDPDLSGGPRRPGARDPGLPRGFGHRISAADRIGSRRCGAWTGVRLCGLRTRGRVD